MFGPRSYSTTEACRQQIVALIFSQLFQSFPTATALDKPRNGFDKHPPLCVNANMPLFYIYNGNSRTPDYRPEISQSVTSVDEWEQRWPDW